MTTQQLRQRSSARKVLAVLVGLLATLLALEGVASVRSGGAFQAFAQASPTPGSPTIKLVNPETTTSREISPKPDGVDSAYHLVAWVGNIPPAASVQFTYTPPGENQRETPIVCRDMGTSVARFVPPDTFDCFWELTGGAPPTGGTLKAVLYSNENVVATDQETVSITTGQTVEITYPEQGGPMGFYTQPNGNSVGRIEFTTSGPSSGDEGTKTVIAYYSTSPPGTEPAFKTCSGTTAAPAVAATGGSAGYVRCTLRNDATDTPQNENDDPAHVTAVAIVPRDINEGPVPGACSDPRISICDQPDPDAADAHRVFGYEQDPTTVTVDPATQTGDASRCSGVVTATVLDQNGRVVIGVNVDVHAQGPTDNLAFDDDDSAAPSNTSRTKPPENHPQEPAINCEATSNPPGAGGNQGDHDRGIDVDVKHIESADAVGTDDDGRFRFQLYSPNPGETQFTVWADEDGNDLFCSGEAHADGSVGWGQPAPTPTGVEVEQTDCPRTPNPSPTPSTSPSPSPTNEPRPECSDGRDNDGDGRTDMDDDECVSPEDETEGSGNNTVQRGACRGYGFDSRNPRPRGSGSIIVGTAGPDDIRGTGGDDIICGLGGRDSIRGRGGDDRIYGGRGHDDLRGNAGPDFVKGNAGLDVLRGGIGHDVLNGGGQNDTIRGYTGRDRLAGSGGDDILRAGAGNDNLLAGSGNDLLDGGPGRDRCRVGPGRDRRVSCEG